MEKSSHRIVFQNSEADEYLSFYDVSIFGNNKTTPPLYVYAAMFPTVTSAYEKKILSPINRHRLSYK